METVPSLFSLPSSAPAGGSARAEPGEAVLRVALRLRSQRDADVRRMYGAVPDLLAEPTADTPVCVRAGAVGAQRPRAGAVARVAARSVAAGLGAGGAAAGLGHTADFTPILPISGVAREVSSWHLRAVGRDLLRGVGLRERRMAGCGYRVARVATGVGVYSRPGRAMGRLSGVCVCGQSYACAICAPRIARERAHEVGEAYRRAVARDWSAVLVTYTAPHVLAESLADQLVRFRDMWLARQRHAGRYESGVVVGSHLAREITFGDNGWHYHLHLLAYIAPGKQYPREVAQAAWHSVLDGRGLLTAGAREHSWRLDAVRDEAGARYCAKVTVSVAAQYGVGAGIAAEVAGGAGKVKGRNLLGLLADYAAGDRAAGDRWIEGVRVVTGTKVASLRWSRGLRAVLGMDAERTDVQVAAESARPEDIYLGALSRWQWSELLDRRLELPLVAAAQQGLAAVDALLGSQRLGCLSVGGVCYVPEERRSPNPF